MICCGVPRTLPSGPELSKTRLTMFPEGRLRFDFDRERDFEDLMVLLYPALLWHLRDPWRLPCVRRRRRVVGDIPGYD
ncbi:hypothetical protein PMES_02633 [Profundibacterium mesophilum KAUST100406-0324]|uniref:Uncharacterized protein n=1 Tax=Profundibacterium mesophilum KAUST100406-0324 TaxID=1037889 RepID=A0A921TB58_9RHOB|nr:hypothetical protein PMES_02633 [Profundibacterium mesophilum KAUST100406-0324]